MRAVPSLGDLDFMERLDLTQMGYRLRIERVRLRLTQQALAQKAKVQQKTITLIERGRPHGLSVATLVALADALDNLSLDYLMWGQMPRRKGSEA